MIVDGKKIAEDILASVQEEVKNLKKVPTLAVITCAPNFETQKYLGMKKARATTVGIGLNIVELNEEVTTEDFIRCVKEVAKSADGVVVQLPLPAHLDRDLILHAIPVEKDPDGFSYSVKKDACLSPVVGAIDEIAKKYEVDWKDKQVLVLGEGKLVGGPAAFYAQAKGALVTVMVEENYDSEKLQQVEIIISGIGKANFITSDLVQDGVVIFDAGTSEDGGVLVGDVSKEVVSKAKLLTPVPGGIGPITIAYLLKNLVRLARKTK